MSCITGVRGNLYLILSILIVTSYSSALDLKDLIIVILSQANPYHAKLATDLREEILNQAQQLKTEPPVVLLSHTDFSHVGDWTILPLLPKLFSQYNSNISWCFFIEDRTFVDLDALIKVLSKYNANELQWLSHAVYDREPTIIHHYAFHENTKQFEYPNKASGIAISGALLTRTYSCSSTVVDKLFTSIYLKTRKSEQMKNLMSRKRLSSRVNSETQTNKDFSIDSAHELALFIWNDGSGPAIKHEPAFCVEKATNCASYPLPFRPCNKIVSKQKIYFAVKTCEKFHKDRLLVVKQTWGKQAVHIRYFSDKQDESIPTVFLGVPNTEFGHCKKSYKILKYVAAEIKNLTDIEWIVLADDDTILSVGRLQQLLSCYHAFAPVALGERYGFYLHYPQGYNYITGGGGIVFSRALLEKLVLSSCECPAVSSPDDMYLAGICLKLLGIAVTHSSLFHQARPNDYPPEYLKTKDAVSFHKHWMIDPIKVYEKWFQEYDTNLLNIEHTEL